MTAKQIIEAIEELPASERAEVEAHFRPKDSAKEGEIEFASDEELKAAMKPIVNRYDSLFKELAK